MTPEQQDLLYLKCLKKSIKDADNISTVINGVLSGMFSKKAYNASDFFDMALGYKVNIGGGDVTDHETSDISEMTPYLRRKMLFYDKWKWNDRQIIDWLSERTIKFGKGYELWEYFTDEELEPLEICLLIKPTE